MKKIFIFCCSMLLTFASCSESSLDDQSIFIDDATANNDFDNWIYNNYTIPYNIKLMYKLEDIETDYTYTVAPAQYENSIRLAHIVKYAWLEAYNEVAGIDFTRTYVPKVLQFVGSAAFQQNGTMVLGTAEGGLKVTVYLVNNLTIDKDYLNEYYFKTMHHEFSHILHQTKNYDVTFDRISEGDYVSGDWYLNTDAQARLKGFVSAYAMSEPREDIAEITAIYVTNSAQYWNRIIKSAGEDGAAKINQKLEIVKKYMQDAWDIDLDELRDVVQRRMDEIVNGEMDLDQLK